MQEDIRIRWHSGCPSGRNPNPYKCTTNNGEEFELYVNNRGNIGGYCTSAWATFADGRSYKGENLGGYAGAIQWIKNVLYAREYQRHISGPV